MNTTKPCPYCKEQVSANAIKCPHCQSELRSWFRRHPIVTGLLLIFVVFPVTMGIFSTATDTTPQEKLIIPGQNAFIKEFTHGAITKEVYNRANQLEQVNDSVGVQQLYSTDLIFELAKGTTVKVIDSDNASSFGQMIYQVRALEGKNKGRAGWVAKTDLVDSLK
jgi:hypothetical protein